MMSKLRLWGVSESMDSGIQGFMETPRLFVFPCFCILLIIIIIIIIIINLSLVWSWSLNF